MVGKGLIGVTAIRLNGKSATKLAGYLLEQPQVGKPLVLFGQQVDRPTPFSRIESGPIQEISPAPGPFSLCVETHNSTYLLDISTGPTCQPEVNTLPMW